MCSHTILLDFSVEPIHLTSDGVDNIENNIVGALTAQFESGVAVAQGQSTTQQLQQLCRSSLSPLGEWLFLYKGPRESVISIRTYSNGLVTINIDYFLQDGSTPLLSLETIKELERLFGGWRDVVRVKTFPPLRRGEKVDVYRTTTDERLLEYDIDSVLFDEKSPFQQVQIVHSVGFGNMLVLDGLQNIAESDLIYTETIMKKNVENYEGKEILILGGGDGGLLHEIRKERPKFVKMIEIDDLVMTVCKQHLRSVCGDTLDNYKGEDYEIIVGDCVDYMKSCVLDGSKFDYIFGDLTDIPITPTPQGEIWDFIRLILNLSFSLLKRNGKFMTHGNGAASESALKMFEDQLEQLEKPVSFTKCTAFIPSFMEGWVFYDIKIKEDDSSVPKSL